MQNSPEQPWWKFGYVWLVIAGPLIVVIASFITLYLAISRPDPVIRNELQRSSDVADKSVDLVPGNLAPAQQARNHAATGVVPVPVEKR